MQRCSNADDGGKNLRHQAAGLLRAACVLRTKPGRQVDVCDVVMRPGRHSSTLSPSDDAKISTTLWVLRRAHSARPDVRFYSRTSGNSAGALESGATSQLGTTPVSRSEPRLGALRARLPIKTSNFESAARRSTNFTCNRGSRSWTCTHPCTRVSAVLRLPARESEARTSTLAAPVPTAGLGDPIAVGRGNGRQPDRRDVGGDGRLRPLASSLSGTITGNKPLTVPARAQRAHSFMIIFEASKNLARFRRVSGPVLVVAYD